jgi:hypothetical protein
MSETGRKCFQLTRPATAQSRPRFGLRQQPSIELGPKLITLALLLVSQLFGHRHRAHRRNAELCLDIDLLSVGDRINVLTIALQMGRWELAING